MRRWFIGFAALLTVGAFAERAEARAPDSFEEMHSNPSVIESPEWYALELKVGPYVTEYSEKVDRFGGDRGWMIGAEFDVFAYRLDKIGAIGVGAGFGWAKYQDKAIIVEPSDNAGQESSEDNNLTVFPMSALLVLRIDALPRNFGIPFRFAGKIGYDFVRWKETKGSVTRASGVSPGLRWAVSAALELDFFEKDAARALDEEWGINHSFLLFEYYGSLAEGDSLPVGDTTFNFGIGFTF